MRRATLFLITLFGFCIFFTSVSAQDIPFNEQAIEDGEDHRHCGGVFQRDDEIHAAAFLPSDDDWIEDMGVIVLRMGAAVRSEDFEYVRDLLAILLPAMVDVLGWPATLDTLTVEIRTDITLEYYRCSTNAIAMGPIIRNPDTGTDRGWDSLFMHELVHAFQDDLLCRGSFPSWLTEGMADAGRYFVAERASGASGRDLRRRRFDKRMAVYDLYNNAGAQVLGGKYTLAYRLDLDFFYQNGAGAVLVPAIAQIVAGFDSPHPMARLTAEFRAEMNADPPHSIYEAMDRAWRAPVDGVSPPSRWVRSRGITCPSVRDGEFVAVIPSYSYNNVNPSRLRILRFMREGIHYEYRSPLGDLTFIGTSTSVKMNIDTYFRPDVPDLPEGAYMVLLEGSAEDGEVLAARTWILNINPAFTEEPLWEGVAVVLTDRDGRPVDIPHESLSVNGRITARVPGGVIALPHGGDHGTLTFKLNGRVIGTVTATGELPRMVVIPIADHAPRPVVKWTPYHPAGGDRMVVQLRFDRSSLAWEGDEEVEVVLYDMNHTALDRSVMTFPLCATYKYYSAELTVPSGLAHGILEFVKGSSVHTGCYHGYCSWHWGYEFEVRAQHAADQIGSDFDGTHLIVTFEEGIDEGMLRLGKATNPDGPWLHLSHIEPTRNGNKVRWDIAAEIGDGAFFHVMRVSGTENRVLLMEYIAPAPTTVRLVAGSPFPNPSSAAVRWPFEVTAPASASFEVYDVTGRRIHSSRDMALHPGIEIFQWDGRYLGDPAAPGIYFLRVMGQGYNFTRKVVLVR